MSRRSLSRKNYEVHGNDELAHFQCDNFDLPDTPRTDQQKE